MFRHCIHFIIGLSIFCFTPIQASGETDYIPPQYYTPGTDPLPPRLFIIRRDLSGLELVADAEMANFRALLARGGQAVTVPPQALRAAADVIPAGTEGLQFLLPTPAPRPFHFAPVVPTVVRSIFGAPHLGGGLGVPMRPEAATRWLQLTDPAAAQYVTLRHILLFPVMLLATQQTAVADRTKYANTFLFQKKN
jgi:hypothetical protein